MAWTGVVVMTPLPIAEPRTIAGVIDRMFAEQEHRHSWIFRAGEQIRKRQAEDAASIESQTHSQPKGAGTGQQSR
jgi:hypothetical protein